MRPIIKDESKALIKDSSSEESLKKEVNIVNVASDESKIDIKSKSGRKDTQIIMKLVCENLLE